MSSPWLFAVIFAAIFTQSAAGFGMALVAMPLLAAQYDLTLAAPLVALVGIAAKVLLLRAYRESLDFRSVAALTAASLALIPVGTRALKYLDQDLALILLGTVVMLYAGFHLLNVRLPKFKGRGWALFFGGLAGFLGGALNASGPPAVVYANNQDWTPEEFKGNLQAYALVTGAFITMNHAAAGYLTAEVWRAFLTALPAIVLGTWLGVKMDGWITQVQFRKMVLWLLVVVGGRLLVG